MGRKKVFCSPGMHPLCIEILRQEVEVQWIADPGLKSLLKLVPEADGVVVRHSAQLTSEVIEVARKLEVIGRWGVGMDNVDVEAATRAGIPIVYPEDAGSVTVAEQALAMILGLAKKLLPGDQAVRGGHFEEARMNFGHCDLDGKVLGLVGLGHIGKRLARMCGLALGMRVLAYDPYLDPQTADPDVELAVDLVALLKEADFVSLHLPFTKSTWHLMGEHEFSLMKPAAFLVNTSRGPIVDENALVAALRSGRLAGAGVDVFEQEPPDIANELLSLPNTLLSPHIAGDTEEAFRRMAPLVANGVLAVLRGERPSNVFNPDVYRRENTLEKNGPRPMGRRGATAR